MSLIDKLAFEKRGARGCSGSTYAFALTSCCERVGIIDDELGDFYWNPDTPSSSVSVFDGSACPLCGAPRWALRRIEDMSHVPEHWRWACGAEPRPGSRRVRPLRDHIAELMAFCRRVAAPVPEFSSTLLFETQRARLADDGRWAVQASALQATSEFAPRFDRLLLSGYDWLSLSVHGIYRDALIIGVEVPRTAHGVPAGLTLVKYSGPQTDDSGAPNFSLDIVVEDAGAP